MAGNRQRLTTVRVILLGAVGYLALGVAPPLAVAQQTHPAAPSENTQPPGTAPPPSAPAGPPAAGASAAGGEVQSTWVKLCEKSALTQNKEICSTNHEMIDGKSGMVIGGAFVRKIEGEEKQQLLVKLPQAALLAIPAGVQIKVDDGQPIALNYTFCYAMICQAETELSKKLFANMRKGKQLMVAAVNRQGKAFNLPVALTGFAKAYDGPPVDSAKYRERRRQLVDSIRQRHLANKPKGSQESSVGEGPSPSQPQPVYPEGPQNTPSAR